MLYNYKWEIGIGAAISLVAFLIYRGINVLPLFLVLGIVAGLLYTARMRGQGPLAASSRGSRAKAPARTEMLSFEQIGGQERAKRELVEALDFLVNKEEIARLGIRPMKGILLTGPPGTGKTLLAKAAAQYTDSVFLAASGSEFVEMYVGVGASRVRDLFSDARKKATKAGKSAAVIFIDEIDVIGGKRDGGQQREYDQTLNQLLTEMDGIHTTDTPRILLMAATNRKEMLDPALLRPGRFDRHIGVDLPDVKGRLHILHIHAKNKPVESEQLLERAAAETFGFSGAQLESVMNEAAIYAMREHSESIGRSHLTMAIDKVMMGEKTDRETTQEERERVARHELGHAIMAELVSPGSVANVTLSPRGQALGYVRHQPQRERYLYTKEFLEGQIKIALGGAAAEEIFYGNRSTGSRGDFDQAINMVRTMAESGLTELGIIDPGMLTPEKLSSVATGMLDSLLQETKTMLNKQLHAFEYALDILIQDETIDGSRFRKLLVEAGDSEGIEAVRPGKEEENVHSMTLV
ncbi:Vesicle-fusing ATPase [Paenibacillus curdlanolyticus YK9]|uniref:Vesicle-fusing ATPase n=1 Tax=Paenibacillus curdlanolyticus YK9 TaxID=717606 RepID=E0IC39_9BACL|nr:AAA family ATPase [Paenibacillus curdlanolyticus]EFM09725.1 Vesicle-fusing ATPase [Paenibacillus curdlanolyticus YK9]